MLKPTNGCYTKIQVDLILTVCKKLELTSIVITFPSASAPPLRAWLRSFLLLNKRSGGTGLRNFTTAAAAGLLSTLEKDPQ